MMVLQATNLSKKYPGAKQNAVSGFSMQVQQGEIVALLGESGSGKTTILRMISGFEIPDSGELFLNGKLVSGNGVFIEPEKRGVGVVFQNYALFPHKTVAENIGFGLFRFEKAVRQARINEVLEMTGLSGFDKRYPHQLSGGQQQRVSLARALAPNPGLILFDEPFSNIDTKLKSQIREEIRDILKQSAATAIFVTHDTKDVLAIADRAVVIKNGITLQDDSPGNLYKRPVNRYVATFFGKANFLKAKLKDDGLKTIFGVIPAKISSDILNSEVLICIRPEAVQIREPEYLQGLSGRIICERFFGEYTEYIVELTGNTETIQLIVHSNWRSAKSEKECIISFDESSVYILADDLP